MIESLLNIVKGKKLIEINEFECRSYKVLRVFFTNWVFNVFKENLYVSDCIRVKMAAAGAANKFKLALIQLSVGIFKTTYFFE